MVERGAVGGGGGAVGGGQGDSFILTPALSSSCLKIKKTPGAMRRKC